MKQDPKAKENKESFYPCIECGKPATSIRDDEEGDMVCDKHSDKHYPVHDKQQTGSGAQSPWPQSELFETLAAIEHQRWADWQSWCHKILRENCPSAEMEKVLEQWDKQIATPYSELSEEEKNSDRDQVNRYWHLINKQHTGPGSYPEPQSAVLKEA